MKPVLVLYKHDGETPLECIRRFQDSHKEYTHVPMTYAGRLDPMAEGILLVLTGEECKQKEQYLGLTKSYEFEVVWGFTTDTCDVLGLVTHVCDYVPHDVEIRNCASMYVGKRTQIYPAYSSKTVFGKPLFTWAREGHIQDVELPTREIEIFSCTYKGERMIVGKKLVELFEQRIQRVRGDFRQKEIIATWNKYIVQDKEYVITRFEMVCSGGTYVRALVDEMARDLHTCGTVCSIKRTAIGTHIQAIDK